MRYRMAFTIIMLTALFMLFATTIRVSTADSSLPVTSGNVTRPARIELKAEMSHVTADSLDNIRITAYMYDTRGNPVADGYKINFTVGNVTNNAYQEGGLPTYDAAADGSFDGSRDFTNLTSGGTGSACAWFGWINETYGGNNSTIWAYDADNASVFASIKIYSAAPTDSWIGYVVDSFGAGIGGAHVTMHVMGYDGNEPYEIYNMTRTTRSDPRVAGMFAFDYIVLQNAAYCYVDASVPLTGNVTIYGRSGNYSMNRSPTSIGLIVLQTPTVTPTPTSTTTPSPTPTANNGMAKDLAIAIGLILIAAGGVYYLFKKK